MHVSTETGEGKLTSNFEFHDDEIFSYDDATQFLFYLLELKKLNIRKGKLKNDQLPLRPSNFPYVAPYVNFQLYNDIRLSFPPQLAKCLEWELTSSTPWIIQKTVKNTGYRLVRGSRNWCGSWTESMYSYGFKFIKAFQKINHFPGSYEVGRKDKLCVNVKKLSLIHGKRAFNFIPDTYVLPNDFEELRVAWESGKSFKWILKPVASSRGRGIRVVNKWTQIPREKTRHVIVQRYLSKPKLINGVKFDLRLYVLISSFDPLKIYLYSKGLARFACKKYKSSDTTLDNQFIHLTNYSINKFCPQYENNDDVDACKGHKWSLKCLWSYLEEQGVNTVKLLSDIRDVIIKTIISGESSINTFSRIYQSSKYNCYELFGIDILLDENIKPWLLEVNISPSLQTPSRLDMAIKGPLVRDVLNIVCFQIPSKHPGLSLDRVSKARKSDFFHDLSQDFRIHDKGLTEQEKLKQIKFSFHGQRRKSVKSILDELTPDDVRHLIQYEDELASLGFFEKIFPTSATRKYFKYLKNVSYYNLLFDAWENRYSCNRKEGIFRLQDLCQKKYHLKYQ